MPSRQGWARKDGLVHPLDRHRTRDGGTVAQEVLGQSRDEHEAGQVWRRSGDAPASLDCVHAGGAPARSEELGAYLVLRARAQIKERLPEAEA